MATKEQTLVRIGELLEQHRAACLESAEKLLRSGAIDWQTYEDNFRLPKILLTACLQDHARDFAPLNANDREAVANLQCF